MCFLNKFFVINLTDFFSPFCRCMVRDKEVAYREKDSEIRDLKEKIVRLSSYVRQLEMQKAELIHQVKSQVSAWLSVIHAFYDSSNLAMSNISWEREKTIVIQSTYIHNIYWIWVGHLFH